MRKNKKQTICLIILAVACGLFNLGKASAQVLFSENFDSGAGVSANWNVNIPTGGTAGNAATFGFDYSAVGIPSAPHSVGGSTIGLKLEANFAAGSPTSANGLSVSPMGQSFTGDFRLTYDSWQNFVGNATTVTGSGTTQLTGAGIGTSGTTPEYLNSTHTSILFAQTGDGDNSAASQDYRVYSSATASGSIGYTPSSGVFAAGTDSTAADNFNAYYATLGNNTVPAAQTLINAAQTGTTRPGAPAFAWHGVEILKAGNTVTYSIDGILIATVNNINTLTLSGNNIEFIQTDINTGVSSDSTRRTFEFGLVDNIEVDQIPEPSTIALGLIGAAGFLFVRRKK